MSIGPAASGLVMNLLRRDHRDINILIYGDSTSNTTGQWHEQYAKWLCVEYPAFSFNFINWDDSTGDYQTPTNLANGTGSNSVNIYNISVSGAKHSYVTGGNFRKAIQDIPKLDLVISNLGRDTHSALGTTKDDNVDYLLVPEILSTLGEIVQVHEGTGLIILNQNPNKDNNDYRLINDAHIKAAAFLDADIADSHSLFIEGGRDRGLYNGAVEPSDAGQSLYLEAIQKVHVKDVAFKVAKPPFVYNPSIVGNSDLTDYSGDSPARWGLTNVTTAKDTNISEGDAGYSVRLTQIDNDSAAHFSQFLGGNTRKLLQTSGGWVTFAVRMYIDSSQPGNAGRVSFLSSSNNPNTYPANTDQRDGWHWRAVSLYMKPTDTYGIARIFVNTGASATPTVINIDRAIVVRGRLLGEVY